LKAALNIEIKVIKYDGWYDAQCEARSKLGIEFISIGQFLWRDELFHRIREFCASNYPNEKEIHIFIAHDEKYDNHKRSR
jgi:hypothetical protein